MTDDNIPTVTITPNDPPQTDGPEKLSGAPTDKAKPLTRDDAAKLVRKYNPDITNAAVQGEVDNILRESKGDPTAVGDQGTSAGIYQDHNTRLDGLKAFAAKEKGDWKDPDLQVRYARLEKERDYPALLKFQQTTDDPGAAEEQFKRVFERPASVMWAHGPDGQPVTGAGKAQFSDYAMADAKRRHGDDSIYYMSPGEYLDLTPALDGKPFDSASGRSLMRSVNRGDQIDEIPSLETKVDGPTATVTDQDGRHRALLAQREGVEAMPVAIRQQGEGSPTEIVGQSGNIMAHDFPKVAGYQAAPRPQSMFGKMAQALMPSAEAAEPDPWAAFRGGAQPAAEQPAQDQADPWAAFRGGAQPQQQAQQPTDNSFMGGVKSGLGAYPAVAAGLVRGIGNAVYEGEKLVGRGMQAVGIPGGATVAGNASQNQAQVEKDTAPYVEGHPVAAGIGNFTGSMIPPALIGGGIGDLIGAGAGVVAALQGGLSGLLTPGGDENFWRDKALGLLTGTAFGGAAGGGANALASALRGNVRPAVRALLNQGVELTPGQMAGGTVKAAEDKLMSVPITGDAIRAARRRGLEDWNRAAYNQVLAPLGQQYVGRDVGFNGIANLRQALNANYDRVLNGVSLRLSPQYANSLQQLQRDLLNMPDGLTPEQMAQFTTFIDRTVSPHWDASGQMSGETFKKVESVLTNQAGMLRRSPDQMTRNFGSAIDDLNGALRSALEDQNPGKRVELRAANAAWARFSRLRKAATQRPTDETGVFTPSDLLRASKAGDNSPAKGAFSEGDALLQGFGRQGQEVLGHNYPDSGTTGRYLLYEAIGGLFTHPEAMLGLLAGQTAGAVPYTAPASRAVNMAMNALTQPAGPTRNALANMLRIGGQIAPPIAGSAAAARFAQPPQPGQQ